MHVNSLSITTVKPLSFCSANPISYTKKESDKFTHSCVDKKSENVLISRSLMNQKSLKAANKIADLKGYNDSVYSVLKNKKASEIEHLYDFVKETDEAGEMRIPAKYFNYTASLPNENIKMFEHVFMSKNSDGLWNYPPESISDFATKFDCRQLDIMSKLTDCKVNAQNLINISENSNLNHGKIIDKAQEIRTLFGDDLRETKFNLNEQDKNSIEINICDKKQNNIKFIVSVDNDLNPILNNKKTNKIDNRIDKLYKNITDDLCIFNMQDCIKSIKEVKQTVPEASNTQILRTMQRLTQFANYNSIKPLEQKLKDNNLAFNYEDTGINKTFSYLLDKKKLIKLDDTCTDKGVFITKDDLNNNNFNKLIEKAKTNPNVVLINLEGWSDGINLFNDQNKLAEKTTDALIKARKTVSENPEYTFDDALTQVLNSDIENRLEQEGVRYKTIRLDAPASPQAIVNQMKPVLPNKGLLKSTVEALASEYSCKDNNLYNNLCDKISDYYGNNANVISKQKMINTLRKTNDKINEFLDEHNLSRENLYFVKPYSFGDDVKSFELINEMYSNLYEVPDDKKVETYSVLDFNRYPENSTFVILDDVIGSGASMIAFGEYMFNAKSIDEDKHVLFCPILSSQKGAELIDNLITTIGRSEKDKVLNLPEMTKDYSKTMGFVNGSPVYKELFGKVGHGKDDMCTVLPYMAPDNNSTLSQYINQHFVPDEDCIKDKIENLADIREKIYYFDIFGQLPEKE